MPAPRPPWPWQATTPALRQAEHAECGLVALGMLMAHHGHALPLAALRAMGGDPRLGSTLAGLRRIARAEGFTAIARRVEPAQFHDGKLPALVHLRFVHFAVLEAAGPWGYRLNDPALGPLWLTPAEFDRDFTGLALWLEGGKPPARPRGWPMLAQARRWLAPALPGLCRAAGLALAGALAAGGAALAAGQALEAAIAGQHAAALLGGSALGLAAGLLLPVAARRRALRALQRAVRHAAMATLRDAVASTRTGLLRPGPTEARLAAARGLAQPVLLQAATSLPALLALTACAVALHPAAGAGLTLLLAGSLALAVLPALWRGGRSARTDPGGLPCHGFGADLLRDPGEWKTAALDDELFTHIAGTHAIETDDALQANHARARLAVLAEGLAVLRLLLPLGLLGAGLLAPGTALALAVVAAAMEAPMRRFAQGFGLAGLTETLHLLADRPARDAPPAAAPGAAAPGLVIEGLHWPADAAVLEDLALRLAPGGSLAITGPSGAGKTALLRLAAGLIEPGAGSVTLDGRPTTALPPGMALLVDGAPFILAGATLRETLLLGLPLPDAAVIEALDAVGLAEMVAARGGLDLMLLRGGAELSGGQRRRLALARALLRNPRLLLVDGAFDALETPLAARIMARLAQQGRSVMVVTAREDIAALAADRLALEAPA